MAMGVMGPSPEPQGTGGAGLVRGSQGFLWRLVESKSPGTWRCPGERGSGGMALGKESLEVCTGTWESMEGEGERLAAP